MSGPPPAVPPSPASRYTWWVGVLALVIMAYILVNSLRTPDNEAPQASSTLPPFAAPAVLSDLDGDANLATADTTSEQTGKVPACDLRGPDIVNSCELAEGGPLVLAFFFTRGARCEGSFDRLQELRERYPAVQFAGVIVRGDREDAQKIVREQGWTFPIAFDRDGAIANVYGVVGCPQAVLAYPGGTVRETLVGEAGGELAERVEQLVAASRRRGWRPAS